MKQNMSAASNDLILRHRGRAAQVVIYLGKFFRMFLYQNDWKVLPMAAIIAGLVSMVVRRDFFITMEGTLKGAFALTCVGIWNGCFNSIQVVCRERNIIKREHRSGMHITSYVFSHMIYQAFLCLLQVAITIYVCQFSGVSFPKEGFMFRLFYFDIGISLFLITYAADMLSLLVSSIAKTTTSAMTIMPFILIFKLVFSGGFFSLPQWSRPLAEITISNYGIKSIAAQANYNNLPMVTGWNTILKMKDNKIGGSFTLGQVLDFLNSDSKKMEEIRSRKLDLTITVGQLQELISSSESLNSHRDLTIANPLTLGDLVNELETNDSLKNIRDVEIGNSTFGFWLKLFKNTSEYSAYKDIPITQMKTLGDVLDAISTSPTLASMQDTVLGGEYTIGQLIDLVSTIPEVQSHQDETADIYISVSDLLEIIGEDRVRETIEAKTMEASRQADYEQDKDKIVDNWGTLILFILLYAALATIALEFVDKDKR